MSTCSHNVYRSVDTPKMGGTVTTKVCTACSAELGTSFMPTPGFVDRAPIVASAAGGFKFNAVPIDDTPKAFIELRERVDRIEKALSEAAAFHECSGLKCPFCRFLWLEIPKEKP